MEDAVMMSEAAMSGPQKTVTEFRHRGFWDHEGQQTVMIFGEGAEPAGLRKLWDNWIVQSKVSVPFVEAAPAPVEAAPPEAP